MLIIIYQCFFFPLVYVYICCTSILNNIFFIAYQLNTLAESLLKIRNCFSIKRKLGVLLSKKIFSLCQLTTYKLFQNFEFVSFGGPTYDPLPPFQWSKSDFDKTVKHEGHPDLWKFKPIVHKWSLV